MSIRPLGASHITGAGLPVYTDGETVHYPVNNSGKVQKALPTVRLSLVFDERQTSYRSVRSAIEQTGTARPEWAIIPTVESGGVLNKQPAPLSAPAQAAGFAAMVAGIEADDAAMVAC